MSTMTETEFYMRRKAIADRHTALVLEERQLVRKFRSECDHAWSDPVSHYSHVHGTENYVKCSVCGKTDIY